MATTADEQIVRFGVMACTAEIRVAAAETDATRVAIAQAIDEVRRIEAKYSRYRADSIVSRINAAAGIGIAIEVDAETAGLFEFASQLHRQSEGLFDITSGVLRQVWDFRESRLPTAAQIAGVLPLIGWSRVEWQAARQRIALPRVGMEIDFGGFGKEYAADRAAALLMNAGLHHGYVNLGGDIRLLGSRRDGQPWHFGIQHPRRADATAAGFSVSSGALATSGDYERYIEVDGERYCHILNPRTGWPARHWQSVSVQAPLCLAAGALTTVAMLMGEAGPAFLRRQQVPFLTIDARGDVQRHTPSKP